MVQAEWDAITNIHDTLDLMYARQVEPFSMIDLGALGRSRLTSDPTIKLFDSFRYPGVHEAYVPGRDVLMLLHAASCLECTECTTIAMGTHKTDTMNNFPDCNPVIAQKVQDLLNCSTSRTDWVIDTPFINMTKDEIVATLADTKYDELRSHVFSGYGNALEY
jgi:7-cyano-7-deazaguanine synthase in queuosine biosynthesis